MAAITVRGLGKRYATVEALRDVDLEVPVGAIVGLVGANGAGKTTLLRILVGALAPTTGTAVVLGLEPLASRREVRQRVGYMPQEPVLYDDLTVRENVRFFARGHATDGLEERIAEVLGFVDLEEQTDRLVQTLSGGQKQRVSLAATLVHRPELLFLDEPTAGVDPQLRRTFWERFRRLADDGTTVVVSTHQMDEVVHCDRVAIMRGGDVLAFAPPGQLLASGGATVRITSDTGDTEEHHVADLRVGLTDVLRGRGLDASVTGIEVAGPTLEDIVLGLVTDAGGGDGVT